MYARVARADTDVRARHARWHARAISALGWDQSTVAASRRSPIRWKVKQEEKTLLSSSSSVRQSRARVGLAVATVVILSGAAAAAQAKSPEDVFRGQIITSAKRIPTSSRSESAYIATLRKQQTTRFVEDPDKKQWKVHFAAFFRAPLNDLEVTVKIYDLSSGRQRLLTAFEQYMDSRGARSLTSQITLEREQFGVNRNLMMVMESRGRVLAAGKFSIVGQGEKFSGQVDFTVEETQAASDDE